MKKTKVKLTSFIIMAVIAVAFALGGGIYMATYQKSWPISVTSRITFTETYEGSGRYNMGGRIKNTSNETIVIDNDTFTLTYKVENGTQAFHFHGGYAGHTISYYFPEELAPGEELDLSNIPTLDREIIAYYSSMNSFTMTVNGTTYNLTQGNTIAIVLFIVGGVFALLAVCLLIGSVNTAKAQNKVIEHATNNVPDAMVVSGTLTNKKDAAKNIGKSIASAMGGALSAAFLGVGAYRVYGSGVRCNFILGKDKILAFNLADKKPTAEKAVVIDNTVLPEVIVTSKNNNVNIVTADKSTNIVFNTKGSGYTAEQIKDRLLEIFNVVSTETMVDGKPTNN